MEQLKSIDILISFYDRSLKGKGIGNDIFKAVKFITDKMAQNLL